MSKQIQNQARTPLMNALRKAFQFAVIAHKENTPPIDELIEMAEEKKLERRKFISNVGRASMLVGAAGLLNACKKSDLISPTENNFYSGARTQPKVVIVGAGMAGLNCAYQLKKANITAKIYEASTRSGGRMYTKSNVMAQGLTTEFGGEFIDSIHDDMISLCAEFGFTLLNTEAASETSLIKDAYYFNNQFYSLQDVIAAFQPYASQIQSDIDALPDSITYNDYGNAAIYDNQSISAYFDSIGMSGWIRKALEVAYLTEYGREVNDQSAINFLYLFSADTSAGAFDIFGDSDERYKISGGNQQLTTALYNQVQNNVTLERKLVKIKQDGNGYKLIFEKPNGNTETVNADFVVLAIPFTILRNVVFDFALPAWKQNAIQNLGYGSNSKLMIGFNQRVWRNYNYSGYLFSDGAIQTGWDNSQLQNGNKGGYTVFQGGSAGNNLGSGTAQTQLNNFLPQLETLWHGCNAKYNGNVVRMHWPTYQYTMASYACYRPGQFTTIAGAEKKRVGNIFFAGEHCSLDYQGYMNGAAETGRKAANKIVNEIGARSDEDNLFERKSLRYHAM